MGLLNLDWVGGNLDVSGFFSSAVNTSGGTITTIQGTNAGAIVTGTSGFDLIDARGGDDQVNAGDGNDVSS